jgi:hypothetical protein
MSDEPDFATAITLLTAYLGGVNVSFDIPDPTVTITGLVAIAQRTLDTLRIATDDNVALLDGNAAGSIIVDSLLPLAAHSLDAVESATGIPADDLLRNMALEVASNEA